LANAHENGPPGQGQCRAAHLIFWLTGNVRTPEKKRAMNETQDSDAAAQDRLADLTGEITAISIDILDCTAERQAWVTRVGEVVREAWNLGRNGTAYSDR
jgi:hypothetical protein